MKKRGPWIRRMGFIRDQEGIMNRYLREKSNWGPHLERTRAFINASFQKETLASVAVLGSGWLLDVPLEEMREQFEKIFLVDIRHPPQIRKRVAQMPEVELIETDLTGGAVEQIWKNIRQQKKIDPSTLPDNITLSPPLKEVSPESLISVNLLNQLDILVCDYLKKQSHFQQSDLSRVRSWLQRNHVEWIRSKPACLITDTREILVDQDGKEISNPLIYCDLPAGIRRETWDWEFDSQGTYHPGSRTRMEVRAVEWA